MDRVIFQNQIWYLGEYSSLLKTFYNNYIIHLHINDNILNKIHKKEMEFRIDRPLKTKMVTLIDTGYPISLLVKVDNSLLIGQDLQ